MVSKAVQHSDELLKIFGPGRVFFDDEIRQLYAHDLSNPPWVIDYLVNRVPDAVCLADHRDQIVRVLQFAQAHKIPVTPAAGRTAAYGGAVPAKGGILLDLTRLNQKIEVDVAALTVTCDPGVVILHLQKELHRYGLDLLTYPTSAPSATIGGFVCQGGVGMGSFREGPIANQVLGAEIVLPNGEVRTFTGTELEVVNECEGITGVVTQVTLRVAKKVERVPQLAVFDTLEAMVNGAKTIVRTFRPWNVTFHNPTFSQLREEAGGPKTVPRKKWSVLAVFDAPDWEAAKASFQATVEKAGGKVLPEATAKADWGEIFMTLRAKALGPSIAPGEAVFPLGKAVEVLSEIQSTFDYAPLSIEGTLMQGENVTILAFALDDERRPEYPLGFAAGIGLLKIAKKHGGRAYASGLYLAAEAPKIFGTRRYDRLKTFKRAVDPSAIMNPGKILGIRPRGKALLLGIPPLPAPEGAPMSTVDRVLNAPPMVFMMRALAPLLRYNRPVEDRAARPAMFKAISSVTGSNFGKKHDWAVYSCSQCGFCRNVSPLTMAVGFEAGSPSGLIWQAREYLKGNLRPTRKLADVVAASTETYVGDDVCPSSIPLSVVFRDWRAQLEADLGMKFEAPMLLRERVKQAEAKLAQRKQLWETPVGPAAPPGPASPGPGAGSPGPKPQGGDKPAAPPSAPSAPAPPKPAAPAPAKPTPAPKAA